MVIGRRRHAVLQLHVAYSRPFMTYLNTAGLQAVGRAKSLRPAGRCVQWGRRHHERPAIIGIILSFSSSAGLIGTMARPLRVAGEKKLWCPKLGIRFSPSSNSVPLYPPLDMSRFVQTASEDNDIRNNFTNEPFGYCANAVMEQDLATLATTRHDAIPQPSKNSTSTNPQIPLQRPTTTINQESENSQGTEVSKPNPEGDPEIVEPPLTPLSFNISPSLFYAARAAKAGSSESFWSHTMYQRTSDQGAVEKVKVHYCTSKHTTEQVCRKHFLGEAVLGFDLEWFPYASRSSGTRENISLIQIANPGRIGLFHVAMFAKGEDDLVAPALRTIMEDPNVSKVGVHIQGDCTRMKNYLGVQVQGVFELSHLYKQVKYTAAKTPKLINKVTVALSTQVHDTLKLPLFKGDVVRSSNWMKRLDYKQILCKKFGAHPTQPPKVKC